MDKKMQARQGDVLITKVEEIPANVKEKQRDAMGRVVLAEGEVTGHAHALIDRQVKLLEETGGRDICYLDVEQDEAKVRHEEHMRVDLVRGKYEVRRQKEFQDELIRNVAD